MYNSSGPCQRSGQIYIGQINEPNICPFRGFHEGHGHCTYPVKTALGILFQIWAYSVLLPLGYSYIL